MTTYQEAYTQSINQPEVFWGEQARKLDWFEFPSSILSKKDEHHYRWFEGGVMNSSYLALDVHVNAGRGDQVAIHYDSPVTDTKKSYTYSELLDRVSIVAGALKNIGVEKGDRVVIYMPMIPEAVFAMLACARIGAVHSVVFGGFAPAELAIRIDDANPKAILTASGGIEISKKIAYKPIVNKAIELASHKPEHCIVFQRPEIAADLDQEIDQDWSDWIQGASLAACVPVQATDPLYILYTSGTTGKPKGVVRDNGGHAVALTYSMNHIYDVKPGEVFWAASDIGWVVGHSYIVYAPLFNGCTTILFEGKPIKTPDAGTFWRIIQEYNVKTLFTAPTAIRAIRKMDNEGKLKQPYPCPSLQYLFLAGERTDAATYKWAKDLLGVHVIDNWWQTESGWPMLAQMPEYGLIPVKPGSATRPVCGYKLVIRDVDNNPVGPNQEGAVCIELPLPPSCLPTLWNDDDRFVESYLNPYPGNYFSGDSGYIDEDGYVFITGRMDDIINVAGHRLSTAGMEEVVARHPDVAECAVIGIEDNLKGHVPVGFVVLNAGANVTNEEVESSLIQMMRDDIGAVASFKRAIVVNRLPKTRSGKILRKVMRAIADGREFRPPSTIEDPAVLDEIKAMMQRHTVGNAFAM